MIISARALRAWYPPPRRGVGECVENCQVCRESTPHLFVVHRRPLLLITAIALCGLAANLQALWPVPLAAASIVLWFVLRRRDRRSLSQCVRCLDRPRRARLTYLIDFF